MNIVVFGRAANSKEFPDEEITCIGDGMNHFLKDPKNK